jgi:hypothetical protein
VEWDKEGYCAVCGQIPDVLESESRAQTSRRIIVTFTCTLMEVGGYYYGFYYWFTEDNWTEGDHLGNCG